MSVSLRTCVWCKTEQTFVAEHCTGCGNDDLGRDKVTASKERKIEAQRLKLRERKQA